MTDADEDYDALSQRHLASIKHDMRVSLEDAAVHAMHKVLAEFEAPPQRQWVGLTDEDCKGMSAGDKLVAMWAEAKLKEKNSGQ